MSTQVAATVLHMNAYNVGIIGCGLIGTKRADALKQFPESRLVKVADINDDRAKTLAAKHGCTPTTDWQEIVHDPSIDVVIVSTTNDALAPVTTAALARAKHVLVEKPAARTLSELEDVIRQYESLTVKPTLKAGFNHRFHPAFPKVKEIIATENIGDIMFLRVRYGHGGRLGYEQEWRSNKAIAGGGELLDQGVHVIDLARYFLGDFAHASGYCGAFFWNAPVEDNCFALMKTLQGKIAQFHVSNTQWKNIFSMEIFCRTGQINIDGLGRSYGKETLTFYKMKPGMGIPDRQIYEWDGPDDSWEKEYADFLRAIQHKTEPNGSIYDARATLKLVNDIYSSTIFPAKQPRTNV